MNINKESDIQQQWKKIILAITVAPKKANHKAPLTLPTSVGSAEMKSSASVVEWLVCSVSCCAVILLSVRLH